MGVKMSGLCQQNQDESELVCHYPFSMRGDGAGLQGFFVFFVQKPSLAAMALVAAMRAASI